MAEIVKSMRLVHKLRLTCYICRRRRTVIFWRVRDIPRRGRWNGWQIETRWERELCPNHAPSLTVGGQSHG